LENDKHRINDRISVLRNKSIQAADRLDAAIDLIEVGDPIGVEPLLEVLKDTGDRHEFVRGAIAQRIASLAGTEAIDALIQAASQLETSGWVRSFAIQSLGQFDDDRATDAIIGIVTDEEDDPHARAWATVFLRYPSNEKAVDALVACLDSEINGLKRSAISALGRTKDPSGVDPLTKILEDRGEEEKSRCWAAYSLGDLGDKKAALVLRRIFEEEAESLNLRSACANGWGRLKDEAALEPLLETFKNTSAPEKLRRGAASGLGFLGDSRAIGPLIEIVESPDDGDAEGWVRQEAIDALGRIEDPRAVEPLIRALQSAELYTFRDPRSIQPLADALKLIKDGEDHLLQVFVAALGEFGDERSIPELERLRESYVPAYEDEPGDYKRMIDAALAAIIERMHDPNSYTPPGNFFFQGSRYPPGGGRS
jgi:HEAT repeat protein